jgi:hypothetical protein
MMMIIIIIQISVTLRSGANNVAIMNELNVQDPWKVKPLCVRRTTNPTCSLQEDD